MFESDASWELVLCISDSVSEEAMLMASRMAIVGELLNRRIAEVEIEDDDPGHMLLTGFARTVAEVGAAMHLSPSAASQVVSQAESLTNRLPRVAQVLRRGEIDWESVAVIIAHTELVVTQSILARLDATLAERIAGWTSWSRKRVSNAVDALVRELDPDAIAERERAERGRYVRVTPAGDGTVRLAGVLTARAGAIFDQRVTEIANGVCAQDPRTLAQRRSDAVEALAEGLPLRCLCGRDECPQAQTTEPSPVRVVLNVIAPQSALLGGREPAYIAGHGVIDAEKLRELAQQATLRILQAPDVPTDDALRYHPSAALARWIRCRDITCRFPGCDRPAEQCDIDHTVPFDHRRPENGGLTVPWNLKCLCRQHHRLKTFHDGWRDQQLADGTLIWTAPTGRTYRTCPGATEVFAPEVRSRRCPHRAMPTSRAARVAQRRAKNKRLRPINAEARRVRAARAKEIRRRTERNRMRATLTLFKGTRPSTSPFCAWINDPYEPEDLPRDWQPPPPTDPGPDEPPF
ncbi:HNH endonuclease [Mycolicibacterium septicum]|nr:HNH endonuclease [Mycolicibacterium septicum]